MTEMTRRQRIGWLIENSFDPVTPTDIAVNLGSYGYNLSADEVCEEIRQIGKSRDDILVAPPRCRDCGYDAFDRPANIPSQCPDCQSDWIAEPSFKTGSGEMR